MSLIIGVLLGFYAIVCMADVVANMKSVGE